MAQNTSDEYMRHRSKGSWKEFCNAIWNRKEKTFLGRTGKRWSIVFAFYLIFYAVLAALFSICMWGLLTTLDNQKPRYILQESLIGINPGLGFRPQIADHHSLIWIRGKNSTSVEKYITILDDFFQVYKDKKNTTADGNKQAVCSYSQQTRSIHDACEVDVESIFNRCSKENHYGYADNTPCVFVKLNKIYGWTPEYYDNANQLPVDMPISLKNFIKNLKSTEERRRVWISCEGEEVWDNQGLNLNSGMDDSIIYEPGPGLDHFYFPYLNQPGYVSPLVAVHFAKPSHNRIINIRCRAWAKNIRYSKSLKDIAGSVHIELMIDD